MIKEGVKDGNWVFLANCHLSLSWMPQLDKLVEQLQVKNISSSFRSYSPTWIKFDLRSTFQD